MDILYESYENDDHHATVYGRFWCAQIFTSPAIHTITSVQLKLYRAGLPGMFDVGIYAIDKDGHPDISGGALCSGSIQGNDFGFALAGTWREIILGNGAVLAANKKYAIVYRVLNGDVGNKCGARIETIGAYTDGYWDYSDDDGDSWSILNYDLIFREYGINAQYSPIILAPGKIGMWGW